MSDKNLDRLDRLVDAAIAGYSAEEPRPGLTQRVMANAAATSEGRIATAWRRLAWSFDSLSPASRLKPGPMAATKQLPHLMRSGRGFSPAYLIAVALLVCASAFWSVEHARQNFKGTAAKINYAANSHPRLEPDPNRTAERRSPTAYSVVSAGGRRLSRRKGPAASERSFPRLADQPESARKAEVFPTPSPLTAEERALLALATAAPEEVRKSPAESTLQSDQPIRVAAIHIEPLSPLAPPAAGSSPSNATP